MQHTNIRDAVVGLTVMDQSGRLEEIGEGDPGWASCVGGLGLSGIITSVTLRTAADTPFLPRTQRCELGQLAPLAAALSEQARESFLWIRLQPSLDWEYRSAYVTTWTEQAESCGVDPPAAPSTVLLAAQRVLLSTLYHGAPLTAVLTYRLEYAYSRARRTGRPVSRAQLSMPPVADQSFLRPSHRRWLNHVQEFFVPVEDLPGFLAELSELQRRHQHRVAVLTVTLRLVRRADAGALPMAPSADCFGVMCYLHTHRTGRSLQHCRSFIRALTEVALRHHGRPYLTYAWAQTDAQLRQAYPQLPSHVRGRGRPGAPTSDFAERVDDAWVGATPEPASPPGG